MTVILRLVEPHEDEEEQREEWAAMSSGVAEGMAVCTYNDALEHLLDVDELVYVREIPNMRGHCVILRSDKPPLVGYHLDRFRILYPHES